MMNKSKKMAALKQRRRRKKLQERVKAIALASGLEVTSVAPVVEQVTEAIQPEASPAPKKRLSRKEKVEAAATKAISAEPKAEAAQPEEPKKRSRKKAAETPSE